MPTGQDAGATAMRTKMGAKIPDIDRSIYGQRRDRAVQAAFERTPAVESLGRTQRANPRTFTAGNRQVKHHLNVVVHRELALVSNGHSPTTYFQGAPGDVGHPRHGFELDHDRDTNITAKLMNDKEVRGADERAGHSGDQQASPEEH